MKKTISVLLISLIFTLFFCVSAFAEEVSNSGNGITKVQFSNGYYGFCIDSQKHGANDGDSFSAAEETSVATNNNSGSDISQKIKIMFTQCFDTIFVADNNGGYYIEESTAVGPLQTAIYHYSDNYWPSGVARTLVNEVDAYNGPDIPDEGYQLELENGDIVTFYFKVMEPQNTDQQSFFAYKLEVGKETPHEHNHSDKWESDNNEHWHECECGNKADIGNHNGNTADCVNSSVCDVCGKELEGINSENHTGNTVIKNDKPASEFEDGYSGDVYCKDCDTLLEKGETIPATHKHNHSDKWESDNNEHWHECECGNKADVGNHNGNTADCVNSSVCDVCGKELEGINSENHTGNTVIKNDKPASEFEDGYSGDVYCKDCDTLLEKGETIPATHKHNHSDKWESDDNEHWHECECGNKADVGNHNGNTADCVNSSVCDVCGKELEGINSENHTGNTVIKNDKAASEFEDGYSGDVYCKDCDTLLEKGETIPATHKHNHSDKWESDNNEHWHECVCGNKADVGNHEIPDGVCTVCGIEYFEENDKPLTDNNGNTTGSDSEPNNNIGNIPETDYETSDDEISSVTPGYDSDNGNSDDDYGITDDEYIDAITPDTGSESDIIFVFALLVIGAALMISTSRKKIKSDN